MNKKNDYIFYTLSMKTPTEEFKKDGFDSVETDILEAIKLFNIQTQGEKEIICLYVWDTEFYLILKVKGKLGNKEYTLRDLVLFSKLLYSKFGWDKYTREPNTLFYSKKVEKIEPKKAYEILKEYENFHKVNPKVFVEEWDLIWDRKWDWCDEVLSDEQALSIFSYLLKTRNIHKGIDLTSAEIVDDEIDYVNEYSIIYEEEIEKMKKKQETILKIKEMLIEWL